MTDLPEPRPPAKRLTKSEREEVRTALKAGARGIDLAKQYGVTRQAISRIKLRMENPEPPKRRGRPPKPKPPRPEPLRFGQRPKPPVRLTPESIDPAFRDDPEYVAYVTSETYWKIQQREYELALADFEAREAGRDDPEPDEPEEDFAPPPVLPAPKRKKGPAFTKPKRRNSRKKGRR